MFQILNRKGDVLAETDSPRYIRQKNNGVWRHCDKDDATHLAIDGNRFDLNDIFINQIDAADKLKSVAQDNIQNASDIEELKAAVLDAYDAIFDLYTGGAENVND